MVPVWHGIKKSNNSSGITLGQAFASGINPYFSVLKLLIQAYKAPPVNQPGGIRIFHLARLLRQAGVEVFVQTSSNRRFLPQDEELSIPGMQIAEIPTNDLRARRAEKGRSAAHIAAEAKATPWRRLLHKLYHSFPFVLFSGDGGQRYMREAVERGSALIEREGITHLFSSYRPWADHLIAYRLKQKYPRLVWIADFRDRPVDPVRKDVWWPGLQLWWQQRLLRSADIATTVSEGLARHFEQQHERVVVVRNGLPKQPSGFLTAPMTTHFRITYTGSLYPKLQSADLLFAGLRSLINQGLINPAHLQLHYAGKDAQLWRSWASRYTLGYLVVDHGYVSNRAAEELQAHSQLNILLSWAAKNYGGVMTAKLGSYLAAGRPVAALVSGADDPELRAAVEQTGAGKLFCAAPASQQAELEAFLLDLYRSWQFTGAVPWRTLPQNLSAYTWPTQIDRLLQAISKA